MHKVQPNQQVMIFAVEIAVPADVTEGEIADEISALLTESGTANPGSNILDWRYLTEERFVSASSNPEEGEIFGEANSLAEINKELPTYSGWYLVCLEMTPHYKCWQVRQYEAGHWFLKIDDGQAKILGWMELPPLP